MANPPDDLPPYAAAMDWVGKITAVALEMTLPGLGGHWLDQRNGTGYWAPLGFVFGFMAGLWHLLALVRVTQRKKVASGGSDRTEIAENDSEESRGDRG